MKNRSLQQVWSLLSLLVALGSPVARAEVLSLTVGIDTTCPYGLVA